MTRRWRSSSISGRSIASFSSTTIWRTPAPTTSAPFLNDDVARPFSLLDLACGDASGIVKALKGTRVASYRGIDLSGPALDIATHEPARSSLARAELVEADFVTAMRNLRSPADIVWISLSLHHLTTPDKRTLMREVQAQRSAKAARS